MKIEKREVLKVNRPQYVGYDIRAFKQNDKGKIVGYDNALTLKSGEQADFHTLVHGKEQTVFGYEPTESQAWDSFNAEFPNWLKDKQGMILWLDKPHAIRELKGWAVWCRVAVTKDKRFTKAEEFADAPPVPAKHPMMTIEEMLVRK